MRVPQVQMPNIYGAINQGYADGRGREAQNQLQTAVQQGGLNSPGAMNALSILDPMGAARMGQQGAQFDQRMGQQREEFAYRQDQDAQAQDMRRQQMAQAAAARGASTEQAAAREKLERLGALTGQVLALGDEAAMEANWPAVVAQAQAIGIDVPPDAQSWPGIDKVKMWNAQVTGAITEGPKPQADPIAGLRQRALEAGLEPGTPDWQDFMLTGGRGPGMAISSDGKGGFSVTTGGAEIPQPDTEGTRKAFGFYQRMQDAEAVMREAEDAGYSTPGIAARAGAAVVGPSRAFSDLDMRVRLAQMDWVRSKLRFESGAVIGDAEAAAEAELYFPQPGDGPDVIKYKQRLRDTSTSAMRVAAGGGTGGGQTPPAGAPASALPADLPPPEYEDGTITRNKSTGQQFVIRNGAWVPLED